MLCTSWLKDGVRVPMIEGSLQFSHLPASALLILSSASATAAGGAAEGAGCSAREARAAARMPSISAHDEDQRTGN